MISKESVMKIAQLFKGKVNPELVSKAYDFTANVMATSKTPQEALRKGNVTPDAISMVRGLLDNPLASLVLNNFNTNKAQVSQALSQAQDLVSTNSPSATVPEDDLSVYRNALRRIR